MLSPVEAEGLLNQFPEVVFAFAYGSGVVKQGGYDYTNTPSQKLPMIDLILVVDDSKKWHTENMQRNPHHYTPLLPLNSSSIAQFQESLKARFWFNPYVPCGLLSQPHRLMKYGVISTKHALEDLLDWNDLYLAGRLHKPVQILKSNLEIEKAMGINHDHAIQTSLLLLPEQFQEVELYLAVASLSYVGDPRMLIGENPKKVSQLILII
jgi:mitochondrial translocator assembly and maintenance protein 41